MHIVFSPFVVPLGAFVVAIVAIISATVGKAYAERTRGDQRIALLAQGIPLSEVERIVGVPGTARQPAQPPTPWNAASVRRAGIILISTGLGIAAFFIALAPIVHDSEVYSGAAVGLIPFFIGIGCIVDYSMQIRDITRYREDISR